MKVYLLDVLSGERKKLTEKVINCAKSCNNILASVLRRTIGDSEETNSINQRNVNAR